MAYARWSPLSSAANLRYQLLLIARNLWTFIGMLDEFGSAIAIIALAVLALAPGRRPFSEPEAIPVGWYLVPIALLVALYAPLHIDVENLRFFYALFPFIFTIVMEGIARLTADGRTSPNLRNAAVAAVILLFAWAPAARLVNASSGRRSASSETAFRAAEALRRNELAGPVVGGAGALQGAPGLAVAFFLDQPWYGDLQEPGADAYERSGARIVVVPRWGAVARDLSVDSRARDLDPILFPARAERNRTEIRLFDLRPPASR